MNVAESAAMRQILLDRGWSESCITNGALSNSNKSADLQSSAAAFDLVIINTCSVRITAEQRVLGRLAFYSALKKKLALKNKSFFLLVCGCMASRIGEILLKNGSDYVIGTEQKNLFPKMLDSIEKKLQKKVSSEEIAYEDFFNDDTSKINFSFSKSYYVQDSFQSFLPVMHGCNNFCTYCIVPFVRGREVSRDPNDIINEIKNLARNGVKEITLLGQNVNSYSWDGGKTKYNFSDLLQMIADECDRSFANKNDSIKWIRFLSSHPKDLSDKTIKVIASNPLFCRHLHLCVQHGSNKILNAMNRCYTKEQYVDLLSRIREAITGITFSTDILVGFPGETEEDFEDILLLMEEIHFLYAFTYHYNPREGTAAFNMPDKIPDAIKQKRLERVMELQKKHTQQYLEKFTGQIETVLVTGYSHNNNKELITATERGMQAAAFGNPSLIGSFARLKTESFKGNTLRGFFVDV